jgi:spore coat polysaccharide biosynthesis protein SpsF (cytidylyltransferase family)
MIAAIIQARMGSTRLPNKVLKNLGDKTVLEQVCSRVKKSKLIDEIFVATTIDKNNLPIVHLCSSIGVSVFCGSEDDVLDRFYQLSRLINPEHIVRITSDCPVIDSELIDSIIDSHLLSKADYTSNTIKDSFPDGLDTEVFKFSALEKAWDKAVLSSEREHVTPYIKNHPEFFKLNSIVSKTDYSKKRWTLDTDLDFEFLQSIFEELYLNNPYFGTQEILNLLESKPYLEMINSDIIRNEGYQKSLKVDKIKK